MRICTPHCGPVAAAADLLRDPVRRAAMGRAGRERVERCFSRARMVHEIADLYREAVGRMGNIAPGQTTFEGGDDRPWLITNRF